jgi:two-component system, cell cycle sensor histidine kinase and response regulator CckA
MGIALISADGRTERCNAALERFVGYSEAELTSLSFRELAHPLDADLDRQLYAELLEGKRDHYQLEKRYIHKDGSVRWGRVTVSMAAGDPPQAIKMVEDLTEAKKQAQVQDQLAWALGERVKELTALHKVARILNQAQLSAAEVLSAVAALIPPAFQYPQLTVARMRCGVFETTTPGFVELPHRLCSKYPLTDSAELELTVSYLQDAPSDEPLDFLAEEVLLVESIVELVGGALDRRTAQERLELAVIGTGVGVWEWNLESGRVLWSEQMDKLLGLAPGQFGNSFAAFAQFVHPEDMPSLAAAIAAAIDGTTKLFSAEFRIVTASGGARWISSTGQLSRDADGKPYRMLGLSLDCTGRRSLEDRLTQAQKMEAIGGLAAGIAHDFNNILSVVLSYAELLLLDLAAGSPMRSEVEEIKAAGRRAGELTRHLLAFSRQQVLQPRVFDLNRVLLDLDKMLRRLTREDIEFTLLPGQDLGRINADPGQIEQVIINLVVNAADAMPTGGQLLLETHNVELDVTYTENHPDVAPGPYVMLAVTDSGVGMTPEVQARIFEPFFTTKEQGKGTGLGLATVFGIVRQSGGHISVYSEAGSGTAFKVYMPREDRPADAHLFVSVTPRVLSGSETILLAEDEPQVRVLASKILRRSGYNVLVAQDVPDALHLFEHSEPSPQLLITDVVMPIMSGRQLAERLISVRPELKVLYMSGYTDDAIIRHGILDRGVSFIQKPLTPNELLLKVRALLDEGKSTRASGAPGSASSKPPKTTGDKT